MRELSGKAVKTALSKLNRFVSSKATTAAFLEIVSNPDALKIARKDPKTFLSRQGVKIPSDIRDFVHWAFAAAILLLACM